MLTGPRHGGHARRSIDGLAVVQGGVGDDAGMSESDVPPSAGTPAVDEPRSGLGEHARWVLRPAALPRGELILPAWLRPNRGEQRWSVLGVIIAAIGLQIALPDEFVLRPRTVAPAVEAVLCLVLLISNPGRLDRPHPRLRRLSLLLIGVLAATNLVSTILLVHVVLSGTKVSAVSILASGAAIWLTNVIAFALWYWEFDRGGPGARAATPRATPDFLFPQMSDPRLDPTWRATFLDYLYVSFTNATAFSPTDTMPLSRWAKILMLTQSLVSLITVGLVAARAINVLPSS
jgi:uncharacterized membrane protein